jgi:hypothetical protein
VRSRRACRLEHLHGADDVDRGIVVRPPHRGLDVGLRGEVEDNVGTGGVDAVANVVLDEGRCGVDVPALAGGEIVDDDHLVTPLHECIDEVRADEARTSGHDRAHGVLS